jgi:hypothetical protein
LGDIDCCAAQLIGHLRSSLGGSCAVVARRSGDVITRDKSGHLELRNKVEVWEKHREMQKTTTEDKEIVGII